MRDTTTMTVRLSKELKTKLERLAASTRRSKSYLAAEAIAEYVELNAWQVEEIGKAVASPSSPTAPPRDSLLRAGHSWKPYPDGQERDWIVALRSSTGFDLGDTIRS
jgi:RHH-type transcriptional regulator, rel operon repressor / antitoxin RelB